MSPSLLLGISSSSLPLVSSSWLIFQSSSPVWRVSSYLMWHRNASGRWTRLTALALIHTLSILQGKLANLQWISVTVCVHILHVHYYYYYCRKAVGHCSVLPSILEAYGHTPLVQLDKIAKSEGIECELRKLCIDRH